MKQLPFPKFNVNGPIKERFSEEELNVDDLLIAGMLAFQFASLIELLGMSNLDLALQLAAASFAMTIPLLCFLLFVRKLERRYSKIFYAGLGYTLIFLITPLVSLFAIGCIFWHISTLIAGIFTVSCFIAIAAYSKLKAWANQRVVEEQAL